MYSFPNSGSDKWLWLCYPRGLARSTGQISDYDTQHVPESTTRVRRCLKELLDQDLDSSLPSSPFLIFFSSTRPTVLS